MVLMLKMIPVFKQDKQHMIGLTKGGKVKYRYAIASKNRYNDDQ